MSIFPGVLPLPVATDGTPVDQQTTPPREGEETGPQPLPFIPWARGYGLAGANGGSCSNPCGFPNYGDLYLGRFSTYDWMLEHPTIQHARSQAMDPIISSQISIEADEGVDEDRTDFIKGQMTRIWQCVGDILRGLDYGAVGFEKIWKITGGLYELEYLKPLTVQFMGIATDPHGAFSGLAPDGKGRDEWLLANKSFLFTYDKKFGNLWGRSRLENMRATAWRDWLDAATDIVKLSKKISGKLGILSTPAGTFKGTDGTVHKWSDLAAQIGALLTADQSLLHIYHMGSNSPIQPGMQNFEQFVKLIDASAVKLELQDFGSNAPAIAGLLDRMKHDEELMFAGYFQSPRTGMATQGGTKADAQQHTDTATVNCENVSASIAYALNEQVVNDILVLNYGEEARGTVRVKPAKLTDDNLATDTLLLTNLTKNPDLSTSFYEQIGKGINALADRRGIAHENPIVLEAIPTDTMGADGTPDPNAEDPTQATD